MFFNYKKEGEGKWGFHDLNHSGEWTCGIGLIPTWRRSIQVMEDQSAKAP